MELLVVLGIVSLLIALACPAVQQARESARRVQCQDDLRELALAAHNHESTHRAFPLTAIPGQTAYGVFYRSISPHAFLTAQLDPNLHDQIDFAELLKKAPVTPPAVWLHRAGQITKLPVQTFSCPSDRVPEGGLSYRANLGSGPGEMCADMISHGPNEPSNCTGAFQNGGRIRVSDFGDGLSYTVLFAEKLVGDGIDQVYTPYRDRFKLNVHFVTRDDAIRTCRTYASPQPAQHESDGGFRWI